MRLIFLDIDGVLNDHTKLASGYCGIQQPQVEQFNRILDAVPDAMIVVSSAWRYMTFRGDMTLKGFEYLLLVHGVKAHERVYAVTETDGAIEQEPDHFDADAWRVAGLRCRNQQIRRVVNENRMRLQGYVVLDDLPLSVPNFVQCEGTIGLRSGDADRAIEILLTSPPE